MSKNSHRALSALAIVALVPVLSACGGGGDTKEEAQPSATPEAPVSASEMTADVLNEAGEDHTIRAIMKVVEDKLGATCDRDIKKSGKNEQRIQYTGCDFGDKAISIVSAATVEGNAWEIEGNDGAVGDDNETIDAVGAKSWFVMGNPYKYGAVDLSDDMDTLQAELGGKRFTLGE